MGKVIIITHGDLAQCLYDSTGMFIADRTGLEAIGLGVDIEQFKLTLQEKILETDEMDFLLLADLFGGTPFNLAASLLTQAKQSGKNVEVVTGVNLPMLLEITPLIGTLPCSELKQIAVEVGTQGIRDLLAELSQ